MTEKRIKTSSTLSSGRIILSLLIFAIIPLVHAMLKALTGDDTVAYTMAELRLMQKFDDAVAIYERALKLTEPSSEMQRQRAIILMLQGEYAEAQKMLVDSFSTSTATLEHVATIALCAFANDDKDVYNEYKTMLDSYAPYEQVDLFAAGECTLEDIFLSGGGEVK